MTIKISISLTSEFKLSHAENSPEPFLSLRKALYYSSCIAKANVSIRVGGFSLVAKLEAVAGADEAHLAILTPQGA